MDLELWMRIFKLGKTKYLSETMGAFRIWGGSKTTLQQKKFAEVRKSIAERYGGNIISPHNIYALRGKMAFVLNTFQIKTPRIYGACKKALYAAVDQIKYKPKT